MTVLKVKKAYKTELEVNSLQSSKIKQTIGVARFISNLFIAENQRFYKNTKEVEDSNLIPFSYKGKTPEEYTKENNKKFTGSFIGYMDFSKWINNEFIVNNPEFNWIKDVSSKSTKQALANIDGAFKDFFKGKKGYPKLKKKKDQDIKCYFPKNNPTDWTIERHRIKIPTIGWVKVKEFGYIPRHATVKSGTVSQKGDRFFVSVLVEETIDTNILSVIPKTEGIGVDLGLKDFLITDRDDLILKNINKSPEVKRLEKKLKREQRSLSRMYLSYKKTKNSISINRKRFFKELDIALSTAIQEGKDITDPQVRQEIKKGVATKFCGKNIDKQVLKVQKLHQKLTNIRHDYVNKAVYMLVKTKPSFITIEDLNVKGMMKNKHLARSVANQNFHLFKTSLINKCKEWNIELRMVDRFFPSSKMCSCCGEIKKDLKLKDRTYKCENCGSVIDRDKNAAINLKNAKKYKILVKAC